MGCLCFRTWLKYSCYCIAVNKKQALIKYLFKEITNGKCGIVYRQTSGSAFVMFHFYFNKQNVVFSLTFGHLHPNIRVENITNYVEPFPKSISYTCKWLLVSTFSIKQRFCV